MKRALIVAALAAFAAFAVPFSGASAATTTHAWFVNADNPAFPTAIDVYLDNALIAADPAWGTFVDLGMLAQSTTHDLTICFQQASPPATLTTGCPGGTFRSTTFDTMTHSTIFEVLANNGDGESIYDGMPNTTCPAAGSGVVDVMNGLGFFIDGAAGSGATFPDLGDGDEASATMTAGADTLSATVFGSATIAFPSTAITVPDQQGLFAVMAGDRQTHQLVSTTYPLDNCVVPTTTTTTTTTEPPTTTTTTIDLSGQAQAVTARAAFTG